jgi:hypothetical protein
MPRHCSTLYPLVWQGSFRKLRVAKLVETADRRLSQVIMKVKFLVNNIDEHANGAARNREMALVTFRDAYGDVLNEKGGKELDPDTV